MCIYTHISPVILKPRMFIKCLYIFERFGVILHPTLNSKESEAPSTPVTRAVASPSRQSVVSSVPATPKVQEQGQPRKTSVVALLPTEPGKKIPYIPKGMTLRQDGHYPKTLLKICLAIWGYTLNGFTIPKILRYISIFYVWKIYHIYSIYCFSWFLYLESILALQFQLRRASKARIDRMRQPKSRRKDLVAPAYVVEEWKNGDKNALASVLEQVNWDKDRHLSQGHVGLHDHQHSTSIYIFQNIWWDTNPGFYTFWQTLDFIGQTFQDAFFSEVLTIVKRKKTYQLVIDEGWYSESELEELGWSKSLSQIMSFKTKKIIAVSCLLLFWFQLNLCVHAWSLILKNINRLCQTMHPRNKIEGAKTKCLALGSTHTRQHAETFTSAFL